MLARLTLSQKGLFWLSLTLFTQVSFVFVLAFLYQKAELQNETGLHAQLIVGHLDKVSNLWSKLGIDYPRHFASTELGVSPVSQEVDDLHKEYKELRLLVQSNAADKAAVDAMIADSDQAIAVMAKAKDAWDDGDIKHCEVYVDQVTSASNSNIARSNKLLEQFNQEQKKLKEDRVSSTLNAVLVACLFVNVGGALVTAYVFVASIARRTERISHNSTRLAHGVPLYAPLTGEDEIATLDKTFHQMADALAEARRKELALVDNARDIMCTLDADGLFLKVNAAARPILGREPEELIGKQYLAFVAPDDRKRVTAFLQNLVAAKSKTDRIESRMIAKDEAMVHVLLSARWTAEDKSLYCVLHDITQRRQLERMKRQFVAMITHDLRSPLNSILNTFEAMYEGIYTPSSEKGAQRIHESIQNLDRMLRLISDLLEMAKFDTTSLSLELKKTSLSSIIQESVGSVRAYAEQKKIAIEAAVVEGAIQADKGRMVQVLVNLLANAIKFSPGGASVTLKCNADSATARIEVTDRGRGISPSDQKIIFEPYRQAESSSGAAKLEGTGLGLTICKSIVEAHHGAIGVVSEESVGSTFWIEIPLSKS